MKLYNVILCCNRDTHCVPGHIAHLDSLGHPMQHCLYYGMGGYPPPNVPHHIVQCRECFDEMSLKMYGAFKHALAIPGWDRLLKTDVNATILKIDWKIVEAHDLTGFVAHVPPGGNIPASKLEQPILNEMTPLLPNPWVGGPAYTISRTLAIAIVSEGAWSSRTHNAEDVWVSWVAKQHGFVPMASLSYSDAHGPGYK